MLVEERNKCYTVRLRALLLRRLFPAAHNCTPVYTITSPWTNKAQELKESHNCILLILFFAPLTLTHSCCRGCMDRDALPHSIFLTSL